MMKPTKKSRMQPVTRTEIRIVDRKFGGKSSYIAAWPADACKATRDDDKVTYTPIPALFAPLLAELERDLEIWCDADPERRRNRPLAQWAAYEKKRQAWRNSPSATYRSLPREPGYIISRPPKLPPTVSAWIYPGMGSDDSTFLPRTCPICDASFIRLALSRSPFCSNRCAHLTEPRLAARAKQVAERTERRAEARADTTCQYCHEPFGAQRNGARFCCTRCRMRSWRSVRDHVILEERERQRERAQ
jgi:endogenous inhibitor of DNA gyrase (YacG/DUF329 family)